MLFRCTINSKCSILVKSGGKWTIWINIGSLGHFFLSITLLTVKVRTIDRLLSINPNEPKLPVCFASQASQKITRSRFFCINFQMKVYQTLSLFKDTTFWNKNTTWPLFTAFRIRQMWLQTRSRLDASYSLHYVVLFIHVFFCLSVCRMNV